MQRGIAEKKGVLSNTATLASNIASTSNETNAVPRKVSTITEKHDANRIWWKMKLENKTVENEKLILQSFGCRAKCEDWAYGKIRPSTDSISK